MQRSSRRKMMVLVFRGVLALVFAAGAMEKVSVLTHPLSGTPKSMVERLAAQSPQRLWLVTAIEVVVVIALVLGVCPAPTLALAMALLGAFCGAIIYEYQRSVPLSCGCLQGSLMNIPISSRWSLHFALMRNALLIVITLISLHFTHVRPTLVRIEQGKPKRFSGGFTFIELVVVLGVMAILMMLVLTLTTQARQQSKRTQCASNLRQIGQAFSAYASENKGYVPRHGSIFGRATPIWNVALAPHLGAPPNFQWHDLGRMSVFRCPTHPIEDIPNGYVLNVFAFETRPVWGRSPPVSMGKLQNTAQLPWLLEASDDFGPSILNPNGAIWVDELHVVHSPETLEQRATFRRHWRKTSNVLFADAHVSFARDGDLPLDVYDDGIRRR